MWLGYLNDRDKPNSVTINSMGFAVDGSVCVAGSSGWGLIRTGNALPGEPSGDYVAVMSKDLTSLRYCSTLPGTGGIDLANGTRWAFASGKINGRAMALVFSAAVPSEDPQAQQRPAAGHADGHLLLLDLSPAPQPAGK